jgi:hypothetical protein
MGTAGRVVSAANPKGQTERRSEPEGPDRKAQRTRRAGRVGASVVPFNQALLTRQLCLIEGQKL